MVNNNVKFSGFPGGISISINPSLDFEQAKQFIVDRLNIRSSFFKSTYPKFSISGIDFSEKQKQELIEAIESVVTPTSIKFNEPKQPTTINKPYKPIKRGFRDLPTKFVNYTVRNGQKIEYEGHVIIIGDVNAGAEIIAYGNVCIYGTLSGVVHAGLNKNKDAFIIANTMKPIQLRIGNLITAPPDNYVSSKNTEIAKIEEGQIVISEISKKSTF